MTSRCVLAAAAMGTALVATPAAKANEQARKSTYTLEIATAYAVPIGFSATTLAIGAPHLALAVGLPAMLLAPPVTHWVEAGPDRAFGAFVGLVLFGAVGVLTLGLVADCPDDADDGCLPATLTAALAGQSLWAAIDIGDVALNPRAVRHEGRWTPTLAASFAF